MISKCMDSYSTLSTMVLVIWFVFSGFSSVSADGNLHRVADVNQTPRFSSSNPRAFASINGQILFTEWVWLNDYSGPIAQSRSNLWATDGTQQGTLLLREELLLCRIDDEVPYWELDGRIIFVATETHGMTELWSTDGTAEGTIRLKSLGTTLNYTGRYSWLGTELVSYGGNLIFAAEDEEHGIELWISDGSSEGTRLIVDVNPGDDLCPDLISSDPKSLTVLGSRIVFFGADLCSERGLQSFDMESREVTSLLTTEILESRVVDESLVVAPSGEWAYFRATNGDLNKELWRTNGTPEGTFLVFEFGPSGSTPWFYANVGSKTFFSASDEQDGQELWYTDGTSAGTKILRTSENPGPASSDPRYFSVVNDGMFFHVCRPDCGLWLTDGSEAGTHFIEGYPTGIGAFAATPFGAGSERMALLGEKYRMEEPYLTDGTIEGTIKLEGVRAGARSDADDYDRAEAFMSQAMDFAGVLYFPAETDDSGKELWRTDGTAQGTWLVSDVWEGLGSTDPEVLGMVGPQVVFAATRMGYGREVWAANVFSRRSALVKDINHKTESTEVGFLRAADTVVYFAVEEGQWARELWATDGSENGTRKIEQLRTDADGSDIHYSSRTAVIGNSLFFRESTQAHGAELWRATPNGAEMVEDLCPGPCDGVGSSLLRAVGDAVFYLGYDGDEGTLRVIGRFDDTSSVATHTRVPSRYDDCAVLGDVLFCPVFGTDRHEAWRCDGTEDGTYFLTEGSSGSGAENFTRVGDRVLFTINTMDEGQREFEMWYTDGTREGTVKTASFDYEYISGEPTQFTAHKGRVFFTFFDSEYGWELWVSDGTTDGTYVVYDIEPGSESSYPNRLVSSGDWLFFQTPTDTSYRDQLWRTDGTEENTMPLVSLFGRQDQGLVYFDNRVLTFGNNDGIEIRVIDGNTADVSEWAKDRDALFGFRPPVRLGNRLFFLASDSVFGLELWSCDLPNPVPRRGGPRAVTSP